MANTVNILGYANTFGDWVVATNADSNEINSIGKYDWTKDSGTLFLNGSGTSISVGNNAIIAGQLQVTGTASSATIDNNLTVGKQVYLTNTTHSLTASGLIYANGTVYAGNTGIGLAVSNNTTMGGALTVSGTTIIANTINVLGASILQNTLSVGNDTTITGNVGITGNTYTSFLTSNNRITTAQLTSTGNGTFGSSINVATSAIVNGYDVVSYILGSFRQANSAYESQNTTGVYANSAYASQNTTGIYANSAYAAQNTTGIYANSAFASQNTTGIYANAAFLKANSAYESQNTTGTYANAAFLKANSSYDSQNTTGIYANSAYAAQNTTGIYANSAFASQNTTGSYANSAFSKANSAFTYANNIVLGTQSITGPTFNVESTTINSANANAYFRSVVTSGTVTVGGDFIITGQVVYATNVLTISSNTATPLNSYYNAYRPGGANASIRWNETSGYWDILDVNNGTQYSQIMTANMISDSTTSTSTTTVPTNKNLTAAFLQSNSAYTQANTATTNAAAASSYANSAFVQANAAYSTANNFNSYVQPAFTQANSAYTQANTATTNAAAASSYANSAFTQANVGASLVNSGGTIIGSLSVAGNLFVNGTTSYINVATFQTVDSLIELASNNTSDSVDIGFYGQYVSTGSKYAGLVRTASSNFALFQGITTRPTSNSVGIISASNYATLNANIAAGQITSSVAIPVTSGGTGTTTSTGSGSVVLSTSPTLVTPALGTPSSGTLTNATGLPLTTGVTGTLPVGNGGTGVTTSTGSGSNVLSNSPTLVTPALGTPASGVMTNVTGLPLSTGVTGTLAVGNGGTGVTTSTGSGSVVLSTSPTLVTPALGTPSSGTLTNATGLPLTTGVTGTLAVGNGGTGNTTGFKLFDATFTTNINALTDRTVGMYGSYSSSATNAPTGSGILYNFMSGTSGAGDGGQFWQDYSTNNLYLRQRWGGSFSGWLTILSSSNYNSYAPTLTGTGASGTWGISISGTAAGLSATLAVASGGTGTTTSTGSGSVVLSTSPTLVTPALGTPSSGNLANCTFPTLNQNTTGTAGGLTGAPAITVGDITTYRSAAVTTGYIYFGNTGTKYIGFDGSNIIASVSPSFNITGNAATATTATNANNVQMNVDTTTNATMYVGYASATSGYQILKSGTKLTFNPSSGDFTAGGNITAYSDERVKINWRGFDVGFVERLAQVKSGVYDRTDIETTQVGVSAQSLQLLMPEAVVSGEDGMLSVSYGNAALAACIELAKRVVELENRLKALEK